MISTVIVDSGPLVAAANAADPAHQACLDVLRTPGFHLVIPALCVAEAAYLINRYRGSQTESRFLRGLEGFDVQAPLAHDWPRIGELVEQYSDFPLGGTDASVIALAERLRTEIIVTLDRRHFGAVRPRHCEHLRLLPVTWEARP
ncbi:MAG TPA: PIN domain-containing protein [Thermoanaerobaculia bacterium]|nr:PIN domain-containing protein [Thermoanaerobaculia bacterium]